MNKLEKEARLALALVKGIGPHKFLQILEQYQSAQAFWQSEHGKKTPTSQDFETLRQVHYLVLGEENYPKLLAQINDPPPVLFYIGNLDLDWDKAISIVGTRKVSSYGQTVTKNLTTDLVKAGCITISGLAFGIDTLVHQQTILAGGITVAVLGTSINNVYPKQNYRLAKQIVEKGGLILSEFYFERDAVTKGMFPRRNRIVAGLSSKTVITEAPLKSGALITANYAFHYNREVFAVPGNINSSSSAGCNWLIKTDKAKLITEASDIIPSAAGLTEQIQLNAQEQTILRLVQEKAELNKIIESSKLPVENVISILTELELKGAIVKDLIDNYTVIV